MMLCSSVVHRLTPRKLGAVCELRKSSSCHAVFLPTQVIFPSSQQFAAEQMAPVVERARSTVCRRLKGSGARGSAALWPGKSTERPPKPDPDFKAAVPPAVQQTSHNPGLPFTRSGLARSPTCASRYPRPPSESGFPQMNDRRMTEETRTTT